MNAVVIALLVLVAIGVLSGIAQGAGADVYGVARRTPRRVLGWRRNRGTSGSAPEEHSPEEDSR